MKFNIINVIDIEATCWEGKDDIPVGQKSEIIEIGICRLDIRTLQRIDKRSILVKPSFSMVSPFCTELTTITQEMLDKDGISIEAAVNIMLEEYKSLYTPWASYGFYDQTMFRGIQQLYGISYPLHNRHTNVKLMYAMLNGLSKEVGMHEALQQANLPLEGTHHRGADDAWNIAGILAWMIGKYRER